MKILLYSRRKKTLQTEEMKSSVHSEKCVLMLNVSGTRITNLRCRWTGCWRGARGCPAGTVGSVRREVPEGPGQ